MEKKYLIVNIGSVSNRYAVYKNGQEESSANDIELEEFLDSIKEKDINGIGLRVVASGSYFREDRIIDEGYLENLGKAQVKAPLHLRPLIDEIKKLKEIFPNAPLVGISDSAFHKDLPKHSFLYNIPQQDAVAGDIYRFGYHGISIQSILRKISNKKGNPFLKKRVTLFDRLIVAHLGGGASITAIKNGKSFDTSMGATPLEGLPMTTRVGNIGAGALISLSKEKNMDFEKLNEYLNTQCGLLGLSGGKSSNVKELFDLRDSGDKDAELALEMFAYNVKKYIGAYTATLGGLDMLVFSGTISEKSSSMREMILEGLEHLGIEIDKKKNNATLDIDGSIESENSKVKIAVIKTNELQEIALKTDKLL